MGRYICICLVHVTGLHRKVFLLGLFSQCLFQYLNLSHQLYRRAVANIIDSVRVPAKTILGWMGKQVFDTRHNIIYIGKVTVHIAMVIDGNGLIFHDLIGKLEIGHIRPAERTIDRKKNAVLS